MTAPIFRSPLTDLTGCAVNQQTYGKCGTFELDMMECLEAYGISRGKEKCADLIADFKECASMKKQRLRVQAMRMERHRQYYVTGERAEHYAPPPRSDAY